MPNEIQGDEDEKKAGQPSPRGRLGKPDKSGKQGKGPEWTGEGDSSIERGQRAGEPSKGGGSQWPKK
jgi:hypothetical protein